MRQCLFEYFQNMKRILFFSIVISSSLAACNNSPKGETAKPAKPLQVIDTIVPSDIAGRFSDQTQLRFDSTRLDSFLVRYPSFSSYKADFRKFYSPRQFAYAWQNNQGLIEQSSILYNQINALQDNGIQAEIPYKAEYTKMIEDGSATPDPYRDLMLTGQYLFYARKVLTGIPENDTKSLEWYLPRKKIDYASLLDSMLTGKLVKPDELIFPQYFLLRDKLKALHNVEKNKQWVTIKPDRKKYQYGDSSSVIAAIRKKLLLSGDIKEDNQSPVFDSVLFYGIKSFQGRYGLGEDGVAGPGVLKEMSEPLSKRIEQILVNMERCRWLPNETGSNYLVVNIPQFKLLVYENNKLNWSCNVVVGKETNKTVIFKGDMKHVVLSPYWNVPPSIIQKEIIPGMNRNKNYLANHNMEWNNGQVRQKPGGNNSLGLVKFLFPNSYNIYLHDTPSKSLFNEDKRAFSHGCIRVSEPARLAEYLLRNDKNWPPEKIKTAMNSGREQYVTLNPTIPVYIIYFTAFVDSQGKLNFRDDIYKRDEKLGAMIMARK